MIWILLSPLDMLVSMLAFPLAPFIVAFGVPWWSWPWLTHDNTIDGDAGHFERWPDNGTAWRRYCRRVAWLWRNRGYNFSYHVCGVDTSNPARIIAGRQFWRDASPKGWCVATCGKAWMIFGWLPYSSTRGLRVYLGWKLRGKIDKPHENPRAMLVTHVNPVKGRM